MISILLAILLNEILLFCLQRSWRFFTRAVYMDNGTRGHFRVHCSPKTGISWGLSEECAHNRVYGAFCPYTVHIGIPDICFPHFCGQHGRPSGPSGVLRVKKDGAIKSHFHRTNPFAGGQHGGVLNPPILRVGQHTP